MQDEVAGVDAKSIANHACPKPNDACKLMLNQPHILTKPPPTNCVLEETQIKYEPPTNFNYR